MSDNLEQQVDAIFQPKAKIFCGNCFYYVPSRATPSGITPPLCRHPNAEHLEDTYEGVVAVRTSPVKRNRLHDCPDWRHKTFYSDVGHNAFKRVMVLLAVLCVIVWFWRILTP